MHEFSRRINSTMFQFESISAPKIHRYMVSSNWRWGSNIPGSACGVPDEHDIAQEARSLCVSCAKKIIRQRAFCKDARAYPLSACNTSGGIIVMMSYYYSGMLDITIAFAIHEQYTDTL